MANPTIGHIHCPICNETGEVRRYATGTKKLYWHCGCGQIRPTTFNGQKFINENATFIGENGTPLPPVTDEKPVNGKLTETEQKTEKKKGLFDMLFADDEAE
ncbi:MAG: hypothetical protein GYB58_05705 [Gammaproteobacteria bacterium]|nr:hypothetical protein [Gammaproteobacteria bacterium]